MNKYKVRLSTGKEFNVESKDFIECYNNALKGEENNVEVVLIELIPNKLTEVEKFILENTDERFKFIARDNDGHLALFEEEPRKDLGIYKVWISDKDFEYLVAYNHLFQNIKWEDNKPYKFR